MLIVPYTCTTKTIDGGLTVHRVHILCQGGRTLWEEDDQDVRYVLESNGIFIESVNKDSASNTYFAKIDTQRTEMSSMYSWQELPYADEETLCWRTFTIVRATNGSVWLPTVSSGPFEGITERILSIPVV